MPVGYTTVSSQKLQDATGTLITNATASFSPVDNHGNPISYKVGGDGQTSFEPVTAQVVAGAFTIQLADTSLTSPVNIGYQVVVTDNLSGAILLANGYSCIQPTGNTWNFDTCIPNFSAQVTLQSGPVGPSAYQVAVANGFTGNVAQWLASLQGAAGGVSELLLAETLTGQSPVTTAHTYGRTTNAGTATQGNPGDYTLTSGAAVAAGGALDRVSLSFASAVGGAATVYVLTETSGNVFTITDSFQVNVPASGSFQTYTYHAGSDFASRDIASGQFIGVYAPPSVAVLAYANSGSAFYSDGRPSGSFTGNAFGVTLEVQVVVNTTVNPVTPSSGFVSNDSLTARAYLSTDSLATSLSGVGSNAVPVLATMGLTTDANSASDTPGPGLYIPATPATLAGALQSLSLSFHSAIGGQLSIYIVTRNSDSSFTPTDTFTVTVPASSGFLTKTWVAGTDFSARQIGVGQLIGFSLVNSVAIGATRPNNGIGQFGSYYIDNGAPALNVPTSGGYLSTLNGDLAFTVAANPTIDPTGYPSRVELATRKRQGEVLYFAGPSTTFGFQPSNITPLGPSIPNGGLQNSWPYIVGTSEWASGATWWNAGVSGQTTAQGLAQYTAGFHNFGYWTPSAHSVSPAVTGSTKKHWYFIDLTWLVNDQGQNINAAGSIANLQALVSAAHADGWYVVGLTSMDLNLPAVPAYTANDLAVNQALRNGTIPVDKVIDAATFMPNQADMLLRADGIHPTAYGHQVIGRNVIAALSGATYNASGGYHIVPQVFVAGALLIAPNGTGYQLSVDNSGNLTAVPTTLP